MYCSTTAIPGVGSFSSDTVTGLRLPASAAGSGRHARYSVAVMPDTEGRPWHVGKLGLCARGSRELRGAVRTKVRLRRLYEGKPDREPLLDSTSPSALTRWPPPYRVEALAVPAKCNGFARGSATRGNGDERRASARKQGVAVGSPRPKQDGTADSAQHN